MDEVLTGAPAQSPAPRPSHLLERIARFFHRHPILALFLLTPGIPEYLSSSSRLNGLFVAPPVFLLFLALNAGMYLPGALLIREAMVRWKKGWASVICWGSAYALVEEGIGLNTIFNAHASVVGGLGSYGHWLGVNWVWLPGVMAVHIVFSISLPILLLHLALPELRGRPLLARRGIALAFVVLVADIAVLMVGFNLLALHFFMGIPQLAGALLAIAGLVALGRSLPADLLGPRARLGTHRSYWLLAVVGALVFGGTLLFQSFAGLLALPAALATVGVAAILGGLLFAATRLCPPERPDRFALAFAAGALLPIEIAGLVGSFPATLFAAAAMSYLIGRLWRRSPDPFAPTSATVPPGAWASPPTA